MHGAPPLSPSLRALVAPFLGVQEKSKAGPCTPVEREPPTRGLPSSGLSPALQTGPGQDSWPGRLPFQKCPRRRPIGRNREGGCVRPMGRLLRAGVAPHDLGALGPGPGHSVFPSLPPPALAQGHSVDGKVGTARTLGMRLQPSPVTEHPLPILPSPPFSECALKNNCGPVLSRLPWGPFAASGIFVYACIHSFIWLICQRRQRRGSWSCG